jgi:hypothetical protein
MDRLVAVAGILLAGAITLVLLGLNGGSAPAPPADASASASATEMPAPRDVPLATVTAAHAEELLAAAGSIEVHRSATCGCCGDHAAYLAEAGFEVEEFVHDLSAEVTGFKTDSGIPEELWSCHTTLVDGYAVEGHVPTEVILALLAEQPPVDGIALPGMPAGSPGMNGEKDALWTFYSFVEDGEVEVFATQ